MRVEVRCCCDPGRLLGTVEAPDRIDGRALRAGDRVSFLVRPPIGRLIFGTPDESTCASVIELELAHWRRGQLVTGDRGSVLFEQRDGLAFKSANRPLELLERIVSWQSVPPPPA